MKIIRIQVLFLFLMMLLVGCGNKEKKKAGFTYESPNTQKTSETKTDANVATIVLTANDMMQYNTKEIKVKPGQKVKLTLRHIGKLDVNVMGHNFVLLKQGVDLVAFASKAATQKDNKYIPKEAEGDIIAHTDMIGGGQTATIEFDAPKVGTYEFLCSFPAHYAMMRGKFIVE